MRYIHEHTAASPVQMHETLFDTQLTPLVMHHAPAHNHNHTCSTTFTPTHPPIAHAPPHRRAIRTACSNARSKPVVECIVRVPAVLVLRPEPPPDECRHGHAPLPAFPDEAAQQAHQNAKQHEDANDDRNHPLPRPLVLLHLVYFVVDFVFSGRMVLPRWRWRRQCGVTPSCAVSSWARRRSGVLRGCAICWRWRCSRSCAIGSRGCRSRQGTVGQCLLKPAGACGGAVHGCQGGRESPMGGAWSRRWPLACTMGQDDRVCAYKLHASCVHQHQQAHLERHHRGLAGRP